MTLRRSSIGVVPSRKVQTVVITGMSGSGKSTALKAFEDMGYFCVDNLPIALLPEFLFFQERTTVEPTRVALVMDIREGTFLDQYRPIFNELEKEGFHLEVLFLDAKDDVLVRRFNQTRRHHPLSPRGNVLEGIALERERMSELREYSDKLLDTSDLNVHQLRRNIIALYSGRESLDDLVIHLLSFGFKHGIPADANLVLDVRFLPNPFFEEDLRPLNGCDPMIQKYVLEKEDTLAFLSHLDELFSFLVPRYKKEGKSYLVIAVGCTGGRHRSVAVVEYLKEMFTKAGDNVIVSHRDLGLED